MVVVVTRKVWYVLYIYAPLSMGGLLLIYGHCCNKKSMVHAIYIYAPLSMVLFLPCLFVVTFAKMQKGFKNCSWSVYSMRGMKWEWPTSGNHKILAMVTWQWIRHRENLMIVPTESLFWCFLFQLRAFGAFFLNVHADAHGWWQVASILD